MFGLFHTSVDNSSASSTAFVWGGITQRNPPTKLMQFVRISEHFAAERLLLVARKTPGEKRAKIWRDESNKFMQNLHRKLVLREKSFKLERICARVVPI